MNYNFMNDVFFQGKKENSTASVTHILYCVETSLVIHMRTKVLLVHLSIFVIWRTIVVVFANILMI